MTNHSTGPPDLEYDLAHEATEHLSKPGAATGAPAKPGTRAGQPAPPVQVGTETRDYDGGDYGYDLAHDIPRPASRQASERRPGPAPHP